MASKMKLYGFVESSREETARLMMAYAGLEYEDIRFSYEEWPTKKKEMPFPFGKLPVMEVDGQIISQSGPIIRYVARKCGLAGQTDLEEAKADMVLETLLDIMMTMPWFETDPVKKAEKMTEALNEVIPSQLKLLEGVFKEGGGEFFTGKLSYADFGLLNAGQYWLDQKADIFDRAPLLKAQIQKIKNLRNIAKWMAERPG